MQTRVEQLRKPRAARRTRGIALMLVVAVVAVASVLGMAVLSSAALQSQAKGNSIRATDAQYLAESGIHLALYYLNNPDKAPSLVAGVYPGQNGVTFGADVNGTVDLAVTNVGTDLYEITSTARAGPNPAKRTTRSLKVRVLVKTAYVVKHAANFWTNFTVPALMTIDGDVRCDGTLTNNGAVSGDIYANGSNVAGWKQAPGYPTKSVPTITHINLHQQLGAATPYYTYRDSNGVVQTGTPEIITGPITGALVPAPTNPKNVWFVNNNVTLGDCVINGTIVVRGGGRTLTVTGNAHITPHEGMPGLIVSNSIRFQADSLPKSLVVDGLCWTGNNIVTTGVEAYNCHLEVNGALMMAGPGPAVSNLYNGTIAVKYVPQNVNLPDLAVSNRIPQSIKIVRWGI
jgi:hypothetical protein